MDNFSPTGSQILGSYTRVFTVFHRDSLHALSGKWIKTFFRKIENRLKCIAHLQTSLVKKIYF